MGFPEWRRPPLRSVGAAARKGAERRSGRSPAFTSVGSRRRGRTVSARAEALETWVCRSFGLRASSGPLQRRACGGHTGSGGDGFSRQPHTGLLRPAGVQPPSSGLPPSTSSCDSPWQSPAAGPDVEPSGGSHVGRATGRPGGTDYGWRPADGYCVASFVAPLLQDAKGSPGVQPLVRAKVTNRHACQSWGAETRAGCRLRGLPPWERPRHLDLERTDLKCMRDQGRSRRRQNVNRKPSWICRGLNPRRMVATFRSGCPSTRRGALQNSRGLRFSGNAALARVEAMAPTSAEGTIRSASPAATPRALPAAKLLGGTLALNTRRMTPCSCSRRNLFAFQPSADSTLAEHFAPFTAAVVLQVLLPPVLIALAFSVSLEAPGERRSGPGSVG